MFGGGNRTQAPEFYSTEQELRIRPYNAALNSFTHKICNEIGLETSDNCLFETRTAFDCVLRARVGKFGSVTDNLGKCTHHINNMKRNIEAENPVRSDFGNLLDNYLDEVNFMS